MCTDPDAAISELQRCGSHTGLLCVCKLYPSKRSVLNLVDLTIT